MHLVPAGDNGGAWTQSGNAGGVSWSGGGNYSLSLDDNGNGTECSAPLPLSLFCEVSRAGRRIAAELPPDGAAVLFFQLEVGRHQFDVFAGGVG